MLRAADPAARQRARPRPANREARAQRLGDGRLIGYADFGDPEGWPVFALHGTPGCRLMFRLADEGARERGLRVIAPDRAGYALSTPHPRRGLSAWTRDVAELAEVLGLERFALVGVSGGAPYAAACAARLGSRVTALALVSPVGPVNGAHAPPMLTLGHELIFRRLGALPWASTVTFLAMRLALARTPGLCHQGILRRAASADRAVLSRHQVKASLLESLHEGLRLGVQGAREDLRLFAQPWDFDLASIAAPACVWRGAEDNTVPAAAVELLARSIPGCELRRIPGAGHYWVFDHFGEVLDWIAARGVPAGS